jgi:putative ABC transport system substrate-binding protein
MLNSAGIGGCFGLDGGSMRRRELLLGAAAAAVLGQAARAQQNKQARVAWLTVAPHPFLLAFRQGLRDLGWVEGDSLVLEIRYPQTGADQLPDLAAALDASGFDVIMASGSVTAFAVRQRVKITPVVVVANDLVRLGVVTNLARPGGNVTGLQIQSTDISVKWLEILNDAFPASARVAVLLEPTAASRWQLAALHEAARALKKVLLPFEVAHPSDLDRTFEQAKAEGAEAIIAVSSPVFAAEKVRIVILAARFSLPAMYEHRDFVEAGGLMSYGPDLNDVFRRAAAYVDRILKGAKPGDLPVEQPTKFELVINLKTAKALDLKISEQVLLRADTIIE